MLTQFSKTKLRSVMTTGVLALGVTLFGFASVFELSKQATIQNMLAQSTQLETHVQTELQHFEDLIFRLNKQQTFPTHASIAQVFPWVDHFDAKKAITIESYPVWIDDFVVITSQVETSRSLGSQIIYSQNLSDRTATLVLGSDNPSNIFIAKLNLERLIDKVYAEFINENETNYRIAYPESLIQPEGFAYTTSSLTVHSPSIQVSVILVPNHPFNQMLDTGYWALMILPIIILWITWILLLRESKKRQRREILLEQQYERLETQARMATLGELSTNLGHELNQPIAAIETYAATAKTLAERTQADNNVTKALDAIINQTERTSRIIEAVRNVSRASSGTIEVIEATSILAALTPLLHLMGQKDGVNVTINSNSTSSITVNRTEFEQIIVNLTANAITAAKEHHVKPQVLIQLQTAADETSASVVISVIDNGPGVDPNIAASIFKPMVTGRPDGLGIGLSLCKTLAERMHGELLLASNSELGACFELRLPIAEASAHNETLSTLS